jgi:hypothetical protein
MTSDHQPHQRIVLQKFFEKKMFEIFSFQNGYKTKLTPEMTAILNHFDFLKNSGLDFYFLFCNNNSINLSFSLCLFHPLIYIFHPLFLC